jgi:anti-sigma B factor antagonist
MLPPADASLDQAPVTFAVRAPRRDGHTVALAVEGDLDLVTAPQLETALEEVPVEERGELVLDFSGVVFIDSTALRVLVSIQQSWHPNSPLGIVCENENVLRIFKIAGLEGSFQIFPTLEQALARSREEQAPRN